MALAFVKATTGAATFVNSLTSNAFTGSTTTGNTIVVSIVTSLGSADVSSVTDSKGNSYSRVNAAYRVSEAMGVEIWMAQGITGGASHTVTAADSGFNICGVIAFEISGVPTTGTVIDQIGTANGTASATLTATLAGATTNANTILIGAGAITSVGTWTVGSGYSNLTSVGSFEALAMESQVVSATGTYSAVLTSSLSNQSWAMTIIAISDTASGGAGSISKSDTATLTESRSVQVDLNVLVTPGIQDIRGPRIV